MSRLMMALLLALTLVVAAACSPASPPASPSAASPAPTSSAPAPAATAPAKAGSTKPLKIGVLNPTTGSWTYFGKEVNTGIELYFNSIGNKVGDTPVQLVFADSGDEAQQALEQARRLVGQEKVDFLMGVLNSPVVPSMAQFADQQKIPYIIVIGGVLAVTGPQRSPYVFRVSMASGQQDRPVGQYAAQKLGLKRGAAMAWDFSSGQERAEAFSTAFTKAGGNIVATLKPPMGTTDFGPFLGKIDPSSIDVLYGFFSGPAAISYVQQLRQFGLTPKLQVVAPDYMTSGILDQMGDNAVGLIQGGQYAPSIDTPENKKFVELYKSKFNSDPGTYVEEGFLGAMTAAKAIEAVKGDLSDKKPFLDALAKLKFNGPSGPFRFDERGQAVRPVYFTKVVKGSDGKLTQQVLDVLPDISQDWMPR